VLTILQEGQYEGEQGGHDSNIEGEGGKSSLPETNRERPGGILGLQRLPGPGNESEEFVGEHEGTVGQQEGLQVLEIEVGAISGEPLDQLLLGSSLEDAGAVLGGNENHQARLLVGLILLLPQLLKLLKLVDLQGEEKKF